MIDSVVKIEVFLIWVLTTINTSQIKISFISLIKIIRILIKKVLKNGRPSNKIFPCKSGV